MFWHIDTDIVGLLVMCALYYYTVKMLPEDKFTARNASFVWCLRVGVVMTLLDIASSLIMDAPTTRFMYHLLMTAYLLTQNLVIVTWFMYALTILYDEDDRNRRSVAAAVWVPYGVYGLLVLSNPWSELMFSLGPNFEYARGPLFLYGLAGLNYVYAAALLLLIFLRWKHIPAGCPKAVLILQPLLLCAAMVTQLLNPGWLLISSAYMFCLMLAFLFFQNVRVRSERAQLKELTEVGEHFACGLAIYRVAEDRTLDIQYLSRGLAVLCEVDPSELGRRMERDVLSGVHPDDRKMSAHGLVDLTLQQGQHEMTYRFMTDAGGIKWLHVHTEAVKLEDGSSILYATYNDLTDLRKVESLLDTALTNTGVSIWEYDFKKRCIIQYQNSPEMHGFERIVQDVPRSLVESGFVHPDSAAAFYEMYEKLYAGAHFAEGVFKVQTSDRKGYWYEHIRYTNDFDEKGGLYRAIGMSTDETERQDAIAKYEQELEKERGFMAEENLLAHATFDLTTGLTLDYRYQDGSEVPEGDRTAFASAKANSKLLIDENERARFLEFNDVGKLLARFAAGENEFRLEYRRRLPNGMVTWVRNTMRLLRDPRSGNVLLFEYWYDVEAEKTLEQMYHSIATDNYDFVARIDGRTKRFVTLAKAGLTYHMPPAAGDDADEAAKALYSDECVAPEDRDMALQNSLVSSVREHLKEYGRFVFTYRMTCPDGSVRYKKIIQYYIDSQREMILMMREDITDLIRMETDKNRVLSEALETANQASSAKSRFLSRVSHELRTPLNAIIGFMELAKDADAKQVRSYLANSGAAAKQLLSIINDVLDMSSIESGKMKLAQTQFNLKCLVENITGIYEPQCRQKGLSYETQFLSPADEWFVGDQLRINQVLFNLLNNALKFTSSGHVRLKVGLRSVQNDKATVRFEVSDTGCGMSDEMRERLFKPFEQESAVTAQKYGGNGLGLSIVSSLVSMMGGTISVQSRQGEGSTFIVNIPFARSETEMATGIIEGAECVHVLAVDEESSGREYMSAVLNRIGVRHVCVEDGVAALAELERGKREGDGYNVCLIDWKMSDTDALELAHWLRGFYGSELAIVVVSAYEHYQADESAKAAGANLFISKQLLQSSLFDLFATLTDGQMHNRKASPEDFDLKDMRVLLAEDNPMNRLVAENMITQKFGAKCECAEDGKVALDMFLASPAGYFDAILMDIQMPRMGGYDATKLIRESPHPDASAVQILALTANAFREDVAKSLSCGMNAHVSKPIEPEVLGEALAEAFAQRRGLRCR